MPSRRMNLIKRGKITLTRGVIVKADDEKEQVIENSQVWYIAKKHNNATYYVHEVDKQSSAVKWTKYRGNAMQFKTENGVHQFLRSHMNDRKDIYLIHAPEKEK